MKQFKSLNKIVSVIVVVTFFLTATAYPCEAQSSTTLRNNLLFEQDNKGKRFNQASMQYYGFASILSINKAIRTIGKLGNIPVVLEDGTTVTILNSIAIELIKSEKLVVGRNMEGKIVIAVSSSSLTREELTPVKNTISTSTRRDFLFKKLTPITVVVLTPPILSFLASYCSENDPVAPPEIGKFDFMPNPLSPSDASKKAKDWIKGQVKDNLITSYGSTGDHSSDGIAWSFDQGTTMVVGSQDDLTFAKGIADKMLSLQAADGLWKDGYNGVYVQAKDYQLVGNQVTVGRGIVEVGIKTMNSKYIEAAKKTADTLLSKYWNTKDTDKGYFKGGFENGINAPWTSTEHNSRAGIFFYRLYVAIGDDKYKDISLKIANWLKNDMWAGDHFYGGYDKGTYISGFNQDADAQVTPILLFNMLTKDGIVGSEFNPNNFNTLSYLDNNYKHTITFKGKDGKDRTVSLYGKVKGVNHIWPEVSANVAAACQAWGNTARKNEILNEITKIQYANGGIPYTLAGEGIPYGFPDNFQNPSVASSIATIAATELGPYWFPITKPIDTDTSANLKDNNTGAKVATAVVAAGVLLPSKEATIMQHYSLSKILASDEATESIDNIQKNNIVHVLLGDKKTLIPIARANAIDLVNSKDLIVGLNYKGETVIAVSDPLLTPEKLGQTEITINGFTLEGAAVTLPKSPVFTLKEIGVIVDKYNKNIDDLDVRAIKEMITDKDTYTPEALKNMLETGNNVESLQALTAIYLRGGMFKKMYPPSALTSALISAGFLTYSLFSIVDIIYDPSNPLNYINAGITFFAGVATGVATYYKGEEEIGPIEATIMQHFGLSRILPQGQAVDSIDNIQKNNIVQVLLGDKKTLIPIARANAIDLVNSKDLIVGLNYKGETVIAVSDPLITPEILGQTEITINGFTLEGAAVTLPKSPVFTLKEIGVIVDKYNKNIDDLDVRAIKEMITDKDTYTPEALKNMLETGNNVESLQALTAIYLRDGMFSAKTEGEKLNPSRRDFLKKIVVAVGGVALISYLVGLESPEQDERAISETPQQEDEKETIAETPQDGKVINLLTGTSVNSEIVMQASTGGYGTVEPGPDAHKLIYSGRKDDWALLSLDLIKPQDFTDCRLDIKVKGIEGVKRIQTFGISLVDENGDFVNLTVRSTVDVSKDGIKSIDLSKIKGVNLSKLKRIVIHFGARYSSREDRRFREVEFWNPQDSQILIPSINVVKKTKATKEMGALENDALSDREASINTGFLGGLGILGASRHFLLDKI